MLNNNLVLSFLISSLSTLFIHISDKNDENIPINKNDILKNFSIIFIVSNIFFFLKKNNMSGGGVNNLKMPCGENLLTHSSRPPF